MNHGESLAAAPRRTRRMVLLSLAILGMACAAFVVRRPFMMSAPRCMAGRWHGCLDTENGVVLAALASRHSWRTRAEVPSDQPRPALTPAD
jgi:hypothetical protein